MDRNEISASILLDAFIDGILQSGSDLVIDGSFAHEIGPYVDHRSTNIIGPFELVAGLFQEGRGRLLDFGCGTGSYKSMIEGFGYQWYGINHREGMADAVRELAAMDPRITFYDGSRLPYESECFDVVFSMQVFEHCQDIHATFAEISRVLKPGGVLVGSVSYLEQIHDYSAFNFTPYGIKIAAMRSGLSLHKIYPAYDVFTWMLRRLLVITSASDLNSLTQTLRTDNRISDLLVSYGRRIGASDRDVNLLRLMFSAHFTFHLEKSVVC